MPGWHRPCKVIFMSTSFPTPRDPARNAEHPLARAFASFTEAAGSLERTYGQLQGQVAHLRQELEGTNRDLATTLEENHRIRERLRRILEGLPCGVLVIESGARISTLNPEAARLLSGTFESADALPAALSAALERARQTGEEPELPLFGLNKPSADQSASNQAKPAWVAIRHAWLEQSDAHATSVFILRDVSEAKNLEAESHSWIEHVQAGLRTLSATVNNVLHLHNTPQPELAPTDAGQLLDWAYNFLLPLAKQARVEMQIINGLNGVTIHADRHRLEQVLLNLALNAFRFMPGGGWLSIRGVDCASAGSGEENESVEIVVRDTGPGIAPDDLPHIFEAGFSTRDGSSGLGLAVCHRILEQHGGSITVESRPGCGANFRLRLPRNRTTGAKHSSENLPELSTEHSSERVTEPVAESGAQL